jgi:N-acetylglucosaminylphosphatidylinositol deacetylase
MYAFVMDDLVNLEQRLLDLVTEVESKASQPRGPDRDSRDNRDNRWTLVPSSWQRGTPSVGMAWMSVRTKALELVRQREALTARVQFLQMSMISSRLSDLEARTKWGEFKTDENSRKMDGVMQSRRDEVRRLETLVQQLLIRRQGASIDELQSDAESARRKPFMYSAKAQVAHEI